MDIETILPFMEIAVAAKRAQVKKYFDENPKAQKLIEAVIAAGIKKDEPEN